MTTGWVQTTVMGLSLTLAGCAGEPADTARASDPAGSLSETEWILHAFGATDADNAVLATGEVTLAFGSDSTFAGSAGCNRYFGRYDGIGSDSLVLGQVGSTMMACPEPMMDQEARFLAALGQISRFGVTGDTLVLSSAAGPHLSFVRVGSTP